MYMDISFDTGANKKKNHPSMGVLTFYSVEIFDEAKKREIFGTN